MHRVLAPLALLAGMASAHAMSAAQQLQLQRQDEFNCGWVQAYTDIKLEGCTLNQGSMLVVPARPISKKQALDLMSTAAVAAEMNRKSPSVLSVALTPTLERYIRVKGNPVRFRGDENRQEAMKQLNKAAVECSLKDLSGPCREE